MMFSFNTRKRLANEDFRRFKLQTCFFLSKKLYFFDDKNWSNILKFGVSLGRWRRILVTMRELTLVPWLVICLDGVLPAILGAPLGNWCPPETISERCAIENAQEEYWKSLKGWSNFKMNVWSFGVDKLQYYLLPIADTLRQFECSFFYWNRCPTEHLTTFCPLYLTLLETVAEFDLKAAMLRCLSDLHLNQEESEELGQTLIMLPCLEVQKLNLELIRNLRKALLCSLPYLGEYLDETSSRDKSHRSIWGWGLHKAHSPSNVCSRTDLVWWHEETPLFMDATSDASDTWVINVGSGDATCHRLIEAPARHYMDRSSYPDSNPDNIFDSQDPANCLLRKGIGGIFIEGDEENFMKFAEFGVRENLKLMLQPADPESMRSFVNASVVSSFQGDEARLSLLKVDVDNCDCCFVEALVSEAPYGLNLRPDFIHVEFHPMIPPPIVYRPLRFTFGVGDSLLEITSEYGRRGHFLHCSLAAFSELLIPLGYRLVHILWNDAVFAHSNVVQAHPDSVLQKRWSFEGNLAELLWFGSYFCHPLRPSPVETHYMAEFQYDFRLWSDISMPETARLESIRRYLDFWHIPRAFYTLYLSIEKAR